MHVLKLHVLYWEVALRLLTFIMHAPSKGLIYRHHDHFHIEAYSDVGYARDKGDQKSITRYFINVGGNLATWRSRKQKSYLLFQYES